MPEAELQDVPAAAEQQHEAAEMSPVEAAAGQTPLPDGSHACTSLPRQINKVPPLAPAGNESAQQLKEVRTASRNAEEAINTLSGNVSRSQTPATLADAIAPAGPRSAVHKIGSAALLAMLSEDEDDQQEAAPSGIEGEQLPLMLADTFCIV